MHYAVRGNTAAEIILTQGEKDYLEIMGEDIKRVKLIDF